MKNYKELIETILNNGVSKEDRTGIGTLSIFGSLLRFDLRKGFPIVTTRKIFWSTVTAELAGFLEGATSASRFRELGTNIWNANGQAWSQSDYLGRIYGAQWRNWKTESGGIDQLEKVVDEIKKNSSSRRLFVSAWNAAELHQMCLPPCHTSFQFEIHENHLSCMFNMRSVDVMIGLPYNIAQYALLTHIVANQCNLKPLYVVASLADTHIYKNHIDTAIDFLDLPVYPLPVLQLEKHATINFFTPAMAMLKNYEHGPTLKLEMNV